MRQKFIAYIDEAGDEGITKPKTGGSGQSDWLVLGGLLVRSEIDSSLPATRDEINALFRSRKPRDLHFRDLKHEQRVAATNLLANKRFGFCAICSCKSTLRDGGKIEALFQNKGHFYNYLTRFLLERLTTAVSDITNGSGELHVVFSRRANTDYHAMREYLEMLKDGKEKLRPVRTINWKVFSPENIKVENHSKWAGLQLADVATSAVFSALEPNMYGLREPRYALNLAKRFLTKHNSVHNCGLTLIPKKGICPLTDDQANFVDELEKRRQAPGP